MPKISVPQISSWNSGEILTEEKYTTIFTLIGNAINDNFDITQTVVNGLRDLKIATRWVGQVEKYSDIEAFIQEHKNDDIFLDPNSPLPSLGDTMIVNNNADDTNFPSTLPTGRYMYIYASFYSLDGRVTYDWVYYNPFTLPLASSINDGLLSKEDFDKLESLPNGADLEQVLTILEGRLTVAEKDSVEALEKVNKAIKDIKLLQDGMIDLSVNKQDKRTNLPGFTSKTVEGNLNEIQQDLKTFKDIKIQIYDAQATAGIPWYLFWKAKDKGDSSLNLTLPFTTELPKNKCLELNELDKYINPIYDANGRILFRFRLNLKYADATDARPAQEMSFSIDMTNLKSTDKDSNTATVPIYFALWTGEIVSLNLTLKINKFSDTSTKGLFTFSLDKTEDEVLAIAKELIDEVKISLVGLFYDKGSSDYAISKAIQDDLKNFLETNLGLEKKFIEKNLVSVSGGTLNGFLKDSTLDLGFPFLKKANALLISQGGTILAEGYDYEEVSSPNPAYNNEIRWLREINLDVDGALTILMFNVSQTTVKYVVWDETTSWDKGDLVIHKGFLYVSTKDSNIGHEPDEPNTTWWYGFMSTIDLGELEANLKRYIDEKLPPMVTDIVQTELDDYTNGIKIINYKGDVVPFKTQTEFNEFYKKISESMAYFYVSGTNGDKEYIHDYNVEDIYLKLTQAGPNGQLEFVALHDIYMGVLPSVELLQATPDEVTTASKIAVDQAIDGLPVADIYEKEEIDKKLELKQDKLDASTNTEANQIKLGDMVIKSALKDKSQIIEFTNLDTKKFYIRDITGKYNYDVKTLLDNGVKNYASNLADKQDKLTAGTGISISGNVITATASGGVPDISNLEIQTKLTTVQNWIGVDSGSRLGFTAPQEGELVFKMAVKELNNPSSWGSQSRGVWTILYTNDVDYAVVKSDYPYDQDAKKVGDSPFGIKVMDSVVYPFCGSNYTIDSIYVYKLEYILAPKTKGGR